VLALYAPGEYEILLPEITPDEAEKITARLSGHLEGAGARVRTGLACYLRDGTTPEEIISSACMTVQGVPRPRPAERTPSTAMGRLEKLAEQVATSELSILILGETGVGKEVMAETLHRLSPRREHHFLRLHCAALSESLLESELFGHERGAFTGALAAKAGLLETAPGGTVFLDEVGELPLPTQVKLLRVLEDRQVKRVGGLKSVKIDVRFIAATNRDLETEVALGRFRQDLYFRLNGVSLTIPPLRERRDEIEPLARSFVAQAAEQSRRAPPAIAPEALARLRSYSWPGNIRELRNAIERAVVLCGAGPIRVDHLPVDKMGATVLGAGPPGTPAEEFDESVHTSPVPRVSEAGLRDEVDAFEKQRIVEALARCAGNQTQAARLLGISRGSLVARLDAYGIPRPRKGG
jgi:DNA-binding NtrC family response regulator